MTPEQIQKLTEELKKQAEIQKQVGQSIESYVDGMKEYKKTLAEINKNKQRELELEKEIASATGNSKEIAKLKLKILQDQTAEMETQAKVMGSALASVNKKSLAGAKLMGEATKGLAKAFVGLPGMIQGAYGKLKGLGLFEMEKEIKKSALSMGILSKQSNAFRSTIVSASKETNLIGVGVKELSQMQSSYSEGLGRAVVLSKEGLVAMGQMAVVTGLGAEGTSKMVEDMELQGVSAERTGKYIEQTLNDSSKMGLNATKVIKLVSNNMKMLNRYNFKDGVKGLVKMAQTVSKLGIDMEFASGFAEKLFNIEGAVDMSAQLQVMGGEWSKLADPFRLMYMARNDINGLTEELANAAASSAKFNTETKEFEIGSLEMSRLRVIAEQTGLSYDELATAGKNAAKFTKIKSQLNFSLGGGKDGEELKDFIINKSTLNEKGEAEIMIDGNPRLLKQMSQQDSKLLKAQMLEQATMKKRAEESITFDEQINYLINELKVSLLPLVKTINDRLVPKLQGLGEKFIAKGGWGEKIEKFAETVGGWISSVGGLMIEMPGWTAGLYLFAKAAPTIGKIASFFWEKAKWFGNGIELGLGFNSVASAGGGGDITDVLGGGKGKGKLGRFGKLGRGVGKVGRFMRGPGGAGLLAAGISGYDEYSENAAAGMSGGENAGRTATRATGSGLGAWGGAAGGAAIGTMIFPGVGTAIGGLLGGILGGLAGDKIGEASGDAIYGDELRNFGVHDAIFNSPIHDGAISGIGSGAMSRPSMVDRLGPDFSKNRGIIDGGKITPIDNKDDLIAMKPGGAIDKVAGKNTSNNVTHSFGELNISGQITLSGQGSNPGEVVDLLKDASFKRDITRIIQSELEKNRNGGKNKG
jgi:hypothetical protein